MDTSYSVYQHFGKRIHLWSKNTIDWYYEWHENGYLFADVLVRTLFFSRSGNVRRSCRKKHQCQRQEFQTIPLSEPPIFHVHLNHLIKKGIIFTYYRFFNHITSWFQTQFTNEISNFIIRLRATSMIQVEITCSATITYLRHANWFSVVSYR